MRTFVISVLAATALVTYRSAMVAAPQQTTAYPGQMTEARVWIQNRPDHGEAIPVRLESASRELSPLRVFSLSTRSDMTSRGSGTITAPVIRVTSPQVDSNNLKAHTC